MRPTCGSLLALTLFYIINGFSIFRKWLKMQKELKPTEKQLKEWKKNGLI
jgi:hypothetical protein